MNLVFIFKDYNVSKYLYDKLYSAPSDHTKMCLHFKRPLLTKEDVTTTLLLIVKTKLTEVFVCFVRMKRHLSTSEILIGDCNLFEFSQVPKQINVR